MNSAEYQFRIPLQALFKQHEFVSYRAEVFVGSAGYVQDAFYGLAGRQRFRDSYGSGKTVSFRSGGISLLACYIFVGFAGVSERESYLRSLPYFSMSVMPSLISVSVNIPPGLLFALSVATSWNCGIGMLVKV